MIPKYRIEEKLGTIKINSNGSTLELRKVSWFDKPSKLDIRNWDGDELAKSSNKLTLTEDEAYKLMGLLKDRFELEDLFPVEGNNTKNDTSSKIESFGAGPDNKTIKHVHNVKQQVNPDVNPILSRTITLWDKQEENLT